MFIPRDITYSTKDSDGLGVDGNDNNLYDLDKSNSFIDAIFDNTPAFYLIVDEEFNIVFASDSYTYALGKSLDELMAKKCHDMTGKKQSYCFQVVNGNVRCPVANAFKSNTIAHSVIEETIYGQLFYYDAYAIPIELEDINGKPFRCCIEILFDQTKEKRVQFTFENDLKQIISTLYDLVDELELNISSSALEISKEASSFNEYLEKIHSQLVPSDTGG
jgi:hypothetical protein